MTDRKRRRAPGVFRAKKNRPGYIITSKRLGATARSPRVNRLASNVSKMAAEEKKKLVSSSYSDLRVLVTGGAGYFGHRLGNKLKQSGADVTLFDCRKPMEVCEGMNFVQVRHAPKNKISRLKLVARK